MNIYEKCLSIVSIDKEATFPIKSSSSGISFVKDDHPERTENLEVYYISDIHLEHRIIQQFPNGATNADIDNYLKRLAYELLFDDIALQKNDFGLVVFAGDIASSFELASLFFSEFVKTWDRINKQDYEQKRRVILPLFQEQEEIKKSLSVWEEKHKWASNATKDLLEYSDRSVPVKVKNLIHRSRDIDNRINEETDCHYQYYLRPWNKPTKNIFAVLGNHELWEFNSYGECIEAYESLFNQLGIVLLNCNAYWSSGDGFHKLPESIIHEWKDSDDTTNSMMQDGTYLHYLKNIIIAGGIGFAGNNSCFNANSGIYRGTINREQEISFSKEWSNYYSDLIRVAKKKRALTIIISHNPFSDWSNENQLNDNCIFFSGHNHQNALLCMDDTNTYVYADNQIGYYSDIIKFKKAFIFKRTNPFADYADGYYEIKLFDYYLFNRYSGIYIDGLKNIEKRINNGGKLYLIKSKGYYGFFLTSRKTGKHMLYGTFICAGGRIRKIGDETDITKYNDKFDSMIHAFLNLLSPYRAAQEQLSEAVKSFGGLGRIHGYIVDIDYYNHIMLNPNDSSITFYFSPAFGTIITYGSIHELLFHHSPSLLANYQGKTHSGDKNANLFESLQSHRNGYNNKVIKLKIKDSIYPDSNRMNQLQRLFDASILREWNEELLYYTKTVPPKKLTL